jgi:hypothetical protein
MASTLIPTKKRCTQKCRALPFLFTEGSDRNGVGTHSSVRNTFSGVPRLCAWIRAVLRGNAAHRRCIYLIERRLRSQARVPEPFSRHKSSLRSVWRNEYAVNGKRNLHGASDFIGASADCMLFSWMSAHVQHERIATIGRAANASRAMRLP